MGETHQRLQELSRERGSVYVPPFDDPDVIAGQGTAGLEILADLPDVDVVVAGVGGGGLLSGVAAAIRQAKPSVRIYGVEPRGSDALTRGLAAGEPVTIRPESIADGLGAPFAGVWTIDLCRRYVDDVVLVDDAVIAQGMRFVMERMKQLVEPAGAAALGAVLAGAIPLRDGDVVCVIASGGNVDLDRLPDAAGRGCSVVAQLVQPVVIDARVMGQLVDDGALRSPATARRGRGSPPRAGSGRA